MDAQQEAQQRAEQIGFWIGIFIGGFIVGTLCGLVPFFVARSYSRPTLGLWALVACMIAGLILGLIGAVPTSIIFTIIILVQGKPTQSIAP